MKHYLVLPLLFSQILSAAERTKFASVMHFWKEQAKHEVPQTPIKTFSIEYPVEHLLRSMSTTSVSALQGKKVDRSSLMLRNAGLFEAPVKQPYLATFAGKIIASIAQNGIQNKLADVMANRRAKIILKSLAIERAYHKAKNSSNQEGSLAVWQEFHLAVRNAIAGELNALGSHLKIDYTPCKTVVGNTINLLDENLNEHINPEAEQVFKAGLLAIAFALNVHYKDDPSSFELFVNQLQKENQDACSDCDAVIDFAEFGDRLFRAGILSL